MVIRRRRIANKVPTGDNHFVFKWAIPGLFLFIFGLFKWTIHFLQQINGKPGPSSIGFRYLISQPLDHETSPITTKPVANPWSSWVVGDEGWIGPSKKTQKIMQQMHGIIPQLFDCWADPVAHLLLLKSSTISLITFYFHYYQIHLVLFHIYSFS